MRTYHAELLRTCNRAHLLLMLFALALLGFLMFNYKPQHQTPLGGFEQAGMVVASIFMCRAAVVAGGDFSGGTIRPWLIARPRRSEVFLGKLAASLTLGVVFCIVAGVMAYLASAVQSKTPTVSHDAAVAGQLLIGIGALTLFGHAIGVLTRSIPVGLTLTLGWVLPVEKFLSNPSRDHWLPGITVQNITLGKFTGGDWSGAISHAYIPFLILEIGALVFFLRQDVNS